MSIEGSLDVFQLPEILQVIAQQHKTGILTVQGEDDIVAVSFLEGNVVGADSLNRTGEEGLMRVLERQELLAAEELDRAQREQQTGGHRLQDVLLEGGYLDRANLLVALRHQYFDLLAELLVWSEGEFKFYSNDEVSYEEGLRAIPIQELLLHAPQPEEPAPASPPVAAPAAPQMPELDLSGFEELTAEPAAAPAAPAPPSEPSPSAPPAAEPTPASPSSHGEIFERRPSSYPIKVRSRAAEATSDDEGFVVLTPTEQQVLNQVDGNTTVAALILETGLGEAQVVDALSYLRSQGLIGLPGDPIPEPSPPPADETGDLEVEPRRSWLSRLSPEVITAQLCRALALATAVLVVVVLVGTPWRLSMPLPWQEEQRAQLDSQLRHSLNLQIDRAAKVHFLLHGKFPDRLDELVQGRLLPPAALEDPNGRLLVYQPGDVQYEVIPLETGRLRQDLASSEAVTGNFLLDLDFFSIPEVPEDQPLVLLD